MNIFKLSPWILLLFFTLPGLVFSEFPVVVSVIFFLFFLSYFFFLSNQKIEKNRNEPLRNKIECVFLLIVYASYFISILIGREIQFGQTQKIIFRIVYLTIFIDLAINLSKLLAKKNNSSISISKIILIFFCLLVPPLGVYYLRSLYLKSSDSR